MDIRTEPELEIWLKQMIYHPNYEDVKLEFDRLKCLPKPHSHTGQIEEYIEEIEDVNPGLANHMKELGEEKVLEMLFGPEKNCQENLDCIRAIDDCWDEINRLINHISQ